MCPAQRWRVVDIEAEELREQNIYTEIDRERGEKVGKLSRPHAMIEGNLTILKNLAHLFFSVVQSLLLSFHLCFFLSC